MRKKFISGVVLAAGLSFSALTIPYKAEAAVPAVMQLLKGQIGKVAILQNTPLYHGPHLNKREYISRLFR